MNQFSDQTIPNHGGDNRYPRPPSPIARLIELSSRTTFRRLEKSYLTYIYKNTRDHHRGSKWISVWLGIFLGFWMTWTLIRDTPSHPPSQTKRCLDSIQLLGRAPSHARMSLRKANVEGHLIRRTCSSNQLGLGRHCSGTPDQQLCIHAGLQ